MDNITKLLSDLVRKTAKSMVVITHIDPREEVMYYFT